MGFLSKSSWVIIFTLLLSFIAFARIMATNISSSIHNNLIYKSCIDQTSPNASQPLPSMLSSLLQELVEKSSKSKFYETYTGDDTIAISGIFQCRGDLTNHDCFNCVSKLPEVSNTLCGTTIPARVQLSGCYIHYKADESISAQSSSAFRHDLQHKTCGKSIGEWSAVLEEIRDGAFAALLSCVVGSGFCSVRYESMHAMAQCAGNVGDCDCGACVSSAVQLAKDECGDSVSGEIYLDDCYVSYSCADHGLPPSNFSPEKGKGVSSGKLVAIVVGGGAALCLGLVCCHFVRASRNKHDDW